MGIFVVLEKIDLVKWILRAEIEKQVYFIGLDDLDGYGDVRGVRVDGVDFVKYGYKIVIVILLNFWVLFLDLIVKIA